MALGRHILAFDLGTSALKAALVSERGAIAAREIRKMEVRLAAGGAAEQEPEDWWGAIRDASRALLARGSVPPGAVAGLCCSTQWGGTVATSRDGRALAPALIWMDSRGAPHVGRAITGPLPVQGYGLRKLIRWLRLAGGVPARSGKDPVGHGLFLRAERPEIYRAAWKLLEPADWLGLRLTGRCASSYATAALHWAADIRDLRRVEYDARLLAAGGLEREKLPDLVPAASVLGPLAAAPARELGLEEGLPVAVGVPDIQAAAVGSGAVRDGEAHLCLGTSSWLCCHVSYKKADLFHQMTSLPSARPDRYLLVNEQECAGACVAWAEEHLGLAGAAPHPHAELDRLAASAPPGAGGVIFTPWLNGERSPVDDRSLRASFFNQSLRTTRGDLARAVLEGVALNSRWLLRYVERFLGRRVADVHLVGGGAASTLWCQIHADVLGLTVRQVEDPLLANVRGAGLIGAAALGLLSFDEVPGCVPVAATFEPDPGRRRLYDGLFEAFLRLYRATRHIHPRLGREEGPWTSPPSEGDSSAASTPASSPPPNGS
ncbi:MAG TPA: FGGY-family carbohydrate kinase [Anaeromyxobacteraceae bacterium]|nr:FGGY-family carbohydrate kinase [Anaeromyxobacteraceae bacterium]